MSLKRISIIAGALLVLAAILVACAPKLTPTPVVEATVPLDSVPFYALWAGSAHADTTAEAFNHWNEDDPAVVPVDCARCHSPAGYLDFLGADSSPAGTVEAEVAAPAGVINCTTCHNEATRGLSSVTFPSGVTISGLGPEARCMECHQGRASMVTVDDAIAGLELDSVSADLGFTNIHYFAAAATLYGSEVHGGYEYEGKSYDAKHDHVTGIDTCVACHDSHTLEVKLETCQQCHQEVTSVEDLRDVREPSSAVDYDGDGNVTEGMAYEIEGLQQALYTAIQSYAGDVSGAAIVYSPDAYPYFFADANGNGAIDEGEGKFTSWTPRLVKAAYNYQLSIKDPGAFAHGNKYIVQLLFDSIADLNTQLASPVDMSIMNRDDAGHFAGNSEPFRHWDEEGEVPFGCVRCHTSTGLPMFLENSGNTIAQSPSNGFQCSTCHDEANWPNRYVVDEVTMPSGAKVTFGEGADSNLCIECHQGRSSGPTLAKAIGDRPFDTVDEALKFVNVHYFAAGATLFGSEAKGMYQFADKDYAGQNMHPESMGSTMNFCTACHDQHALTVEVGTCATCHQGITDPRDIRMATDAVDYDGDGDVTEPLSQEVAHMADVLYATMQTYATETAGTPIVYSASAYPYFFADANGNGEIDEGEGTYATFTPNLLVAAYNYQYFQKDPGAFAHNGKYVMQVLYDTIESLGGDVSAMTRP
jgi:hypothetical protein